MKATRAGDVYVQYRKLSSLSLLVIESTNV